MIDSFTGRYFAVALCNMMIDLARDHEILNLNHLRMQRYCFIAQCYYIQNLNKPIIGDTIYKEMSGTIITDVYREFSGFGNSSIDAYAYNADGSYFTHDERDGLILIILKNILIKYQMYSNDALLNLIKMDDTAWSNAGDIGSRITNDIIRNSEIPLFNLQGW